jgi:tellurite resistance protein
VAHGDPEDLIESALERLSDADCRKAIGYALEVAHADGEFDVEEQGTLFALAKNFGVSADEMTEMMKTQAQVKYNVAGRA